MIRSLRVFILLSIIGGISYAQAEITPPSANASCEEQVTYWKTQADTYAAAAQQDAEQINSILQLLGANNVDSALSTIASLKKQAQTSPPKKNVRFNEGDARGGTQELLTVLNASTVAEAIEIVLESQRYVGEAITNIITSIANAINSTSLNTALNKGIKPLENPETIRTLNQQLYDAIFGLKKKYFDNVYLLRVFVEPQLKQLNALVKAKRDRVQPANIINLIPNTIPQAPTKFSGSEQQLINEINNLVLE